MWALLATPFGRGALKVLTVVLAIAFLYFCFKIWIKLHDEKVLSGYVLLTEKTAADALVTDLQQQLIIQQKTYEETRKRQLADDLVLQAKDAANDKDIADYEQKLAAAKRACYADDDDAHFLSNH